MLTKMDKEILIKVMTDAQKLFEYYAECIAEGFVESDDDGEEEMACYQEIKAFVKECREKLSKMKILQQRIAELEEALKKIAESEGDCENQKFNLTRFQASQIARKALYCSPYKKELAMKHSDFGVGVGHFIGKVVKEGKTDIDIGFAEALKNFLFADRFKVMNVLENDISQSRLVITNEQGEWLEIGADGIIKIGEFPEIKEDNEL